MKCEIANIMQARKIGSYKYFDLIGKIRDTGRASIQANTYLVDDEYLTSNEQSSIGSTIAEWADGDLIAAHIGEGLDIICTNDIAGGNDTKSVFSSLHRKWLSDDYSCKFLTPKELAEMLKSVG